MLHFVKKISKELNIKYGSGGAVAEVLPENCPIPLKRIGLADTFAESGEYELLLDKYGLSSTHIVEAAKHVIKMKR